MFNDSSVRLVVVVRVDSNMFSTALKTLLTIVMLVRSCTFFALLLSKID